jgi:hypothetical protein
MKRKMMEKLLELYPGWRLHCEVTPAGVRSYRIHMTLIDGDGNTINAVEHIASGSLADLKAEATQQLLDGIALLED